MGRYGNRAELEQVLRATIDKTYGGTDRFNMAGLMRDLNIVGDRTYGYTCDAVTDKEVFEQALRTNQRNPDEPLVPARQRWVIPYMYRDASNYKQHLELAVDAPVSDTDRQTLFDRLDRSLADGATGQDFIPGDVGVEPAEWSDSDPDFTTTVDFSFYPGDDGHYADDHPWHELHLGDARQEGSLSAVEPKLETLVERFEAASAAGWPGQAGTPFDWHGDLASGPPRMDGSSRDRPGGRQDRRPRGTSSGGQFAPKSLPEAPGGTNVLDDE